MNKFSPHLEIAKNYWKNFLEKNDIVIDATCGNGNDSLFISKLLDLTKGKLYLFDIQKKAIENTLLLLKNSLAQEIFEKIYLINDSHADFSKYINFKVNLIIYNLGYLPKGNKEITTKLETTLLSIQSGLTLLDDRGAISITCYPGHKEGEKEERNLVSYLSSLDNSKFSVCYYKWLNKEKAPSLFWIRKKTL